MVYQYQIIIENSKHMKKSILSNKSKFIAFYKNIHETITTKMRNVAVILKKILSIVACYCSFNLFFHRFFLFPSSFFTLNRSKSFFMSNRVSLLWTFSIAFILQLVLIPQIFMYMEMDVLLISMLGLPFWIKKYN